MRQTLRMDKFNSASSQSTILTKAVTMVSSQLYLRYEQWANTILHRRKRFSKQLDL